MHDGDVSYIIILLCTANNVRSYTKHRASDSTIFSSAMHIAILRYFLLEFANVDSPIFSIANVSHYMVRDAPILLA